MNKNGYRLELHVLPNRAAVPNTFALLITRNGKPVHGADVTAGIAMLDMEMGEQSYRLREVSASRASCSRCRSSRSPRAWLRASSRCSCWWTRLARHALIVLLALGAMCTFAGAARAHGDPASDYLLAQDVFLPAAETVSADEVRRLTTAVREAKAAGFRIKVALIAQPSDLGSVFQLYGKPQPYAQFLGQEVVFIYRGHLLVVMRDGLGLSNGGKPEPRLARTISGMRPGEGATQLARAGTTAVVRLARAAGHPIAAPPEASSGENQTSDRIKIAALATTAAVIAAAVGWFRRRRASP